ncbi:MAG TPA: TadG family pilus assembly protein [Acidobacteriota bacterium]|nr:TadG family pilus assembly protein [Acidobacteriota bacterium]
MLRAIRRRKGRDSRRRGRQRGAVIITFAALLVVIVSFMALAIDLAHLFVVSNELKNAADAGALAGARFLYSADGSSVNPNANQIAYEAALENISENVPVEVQWTGGNTGDVERGHWSFATRNFTPNSSLDPPDLWNKTTEELDEDPDFINAVRVRTRRQQTPALSFFARIFGYDSFEMQRESVAYIGFSGTLAPHEVDQPIAICKESILNPQGEYDCSIGRMINSGNNPATSNTGGWTNFTQPCQTANPPSVSPYVCSTGNTEMLFYGQGMGTTGGMQDNVFRQLADCFDPAHRVEPWQLTLPVIECPGNNVSNCSRLVGAVTVSIVWIQRDNDPDYSDVPYRMGNWSSTEPNGQLRWADFVNHFNLRNADGNPAPWQMKAIYFLPDCTYHEPAGTTGGENFGVLAKIPVLVQ